MNSITQTMPVPEKSEGHFVFHRPRASSHPQQTLNTMKARSHKDDAPQREATGTTNFLGPCNICRSEWPSHTGEIPTRNVASTPRRRGWQLPRQVNWPTTPQGAPVNPLQPGFSSKQEYGPDLPPPPPKTSETTYLSTAGNQQSFWRSGEHLLSLKYWANRCDQEAAAGHCLNLPWR